MSISNFYDHFPCWHLWPLKPKLQEFYISSLEALVIEFPCFTWLIPLFPLLESWKVCFYHFMNLYMDSPDLKILRSHWVAGEAQRINNLNKNNQDWVGVLQSRNVFFPYHLWSKPVFSPYYFPFWYINNSSSISRAMLIYTHRGLGLKSLI